MMKLFIYLFFLFSIPLLPSNFVLDVIGLHWFAFSILNLIYVLFYIRSIKFNFFNSWLFKLFALFVVSAVVSLLYTNNLTLSIVDLSRILTSFVSIVILINLFQSPFSFFKLSLLISFFLLIDLFFAFKPFIVFSIDNSISFLQVFNANYDPSLLKGLTGNKNINAAYILIKVPFLLFLLFSNKKKYLFYIVNFVLFLVLVLIFLLKSRAAYLSLFIISFFYIIFFLFYSKKSLIYIPIFIASFLLSSSIINKSSSSTLTSEISSIKFTNESSSSRFILWQNAIEASYKNKFLGFGIGNWKIESLPYWNKRGSAYLVPYHAHNDFFELLSEIGLHGAIFYLSIFLFSFYLILKCFIKNKSIIDLTIGSSLLIYFVDANLNFPLERVVMQLSFVILFSLIYIRYAKPSSNN